MRWAFILALIFLIKSTAGKENQCGYFKSCQDCLSMAGDGCIWCYDGDITGCIQTEKSKHCQQYYDSENLFQVDESHNPRGQLTFRPKAAHIKMRPNSRKRFSFTATKDETDVDIYFLLDISNSMEVYKDRLAKMSRKMGNVISKYTSKYQFGFGGFSEKPLPPFASLDHHPVNFIHYLPLTQDLDQFARLVNNSRLYENLDPPESGLDALMQVILCDEAIGWRTGVMNIIVYISDQVFHFAGDGIYGGLWKPYKHECQLERRNDFYIFDGIETDYPSLSQVNYWLRKKGKKLLFGVPSELKDLFEKLSSNGALDSTTGTIGAGEDDILNLLLDHYIEAREEIVLEIAGLENNPQLEVSWIDIQGEFGDPRRGRGSQFSRKDVDSGDSRKLTLNGIQELVPVNLEVDIYLGNNSCDSYNFTVSIHGQDEKQMTVTVAGACDCDCQNHPSEVLTDRCNCHGREICGICHCQDGFSGEFCECNNDDPECPQSNQVDECNGRGSRRCGKKCFCYEGFFGENCECSIDSCNCENDGECLCELGAEVCKCQDGWEGRRCQCREQTERCTDPFSQTVCNDRGLCSCGKCHCSSEVDIVTGDFCQRVVSSERSSTCEVLRPCLLVILDKASEDDRQQCQSSLYLESLDCYLYHQDFNSSSNSSLSLEDYGSCNNLQESFRLPDVSSMNYCEVEVDGCLFSYWYSNIDQYQLEDVEKIRNGDWKDRIFVELHKVESGYDWKSCSVFPTEIAVPIIVGITLLIGIATFIIYVILVNLRDKWEYERFMDSQLRVVWSNRSELYHSLRSRSSASLRHRITRAVSTISNRGSARPA